MADTDVIGDVSSALERLLTDAMRTLTPAPAPIARMHDLRGDIPTSPPLLTLFLYDIAQDPSVRNRAPVREVDGTGYRVRKPPMGLLLRYLVAAWGGDRLTEQRMLGRVLQVFYDRATLGGPDLDGAVAATTDSIKITLAALTLEEKTRVWHAIQQPYRVSLNYEVRVANIDAELAEAAVPVAARVLDVAVPDPGPVP